MNIFGHQQSAKTDRFATACGSLPQRRYRAVGVCDTRGRPLCVVWDGAQVCDVAVEEVQEHCLVPPDPEEVPALALAATLYLQA